jgi:hypothetical protein
VPPKKGKLPKLNYFYYRGDLHKKYHINRGKDVVTAWNYPKGKMERYVYSDVRRNGEKAFTTKQVCAMVQRGRTVVEMAIVNGMIPAPQQTYGVDENRNKFAYYWSEKDVMALHEYLQSVHYGRPRKDGLITPKAMPSVAELRAMMRQGVILGVQGENGEFIPTWQAEKF